MMTQTTGRISSLDEIAVSGEGEKNLSTLPPQEFEERKQLQNKHVLTEQWLFVLELAVVCIVIIIVWGLLSLSVIFYHLPEKQVYIIHIKHVYMNTKKCRTIRVL